MANCVVFCVFLCVQLALCQFGFFPNREERRQNFNFQNLLDPNRIRNRLTGILHIRPNEGQDNSGYVFPFRRPGGITNAQTGRPAYQDEYGGNYQNYPNQYGQGNNVVFPTNPTNNRPYPNYGSNVNFNQNVNQFPNDYGNNQYQTYNPNNPNNHQPINNYPPNNQNYGQNPDNDQEIPNDPVNFEEPTTPAPSIDPVMIVNTAIDNQNNPGYESVTLKPDEPAFTKLPELTPVPDTDKRVNANFGSAGLFKESCQTVDNEIGSCIPIQNCGTYLKIVQGSQSNPEAIQLLRRAHCGFEGSNPKVCCPRPGIPTAPPQNEAFTTTTTTTTTTHKPETPPPNEAQGKSSEEFLDSFPDYPECGKTGGSLGRVVGGVPAPLGAFPWMALLGYKRGSGARWLCGGSLVTSRHVLTAAHCIHLHENDLFVVRLGELDLADDNEGATPTDVLIKKMMKHEQYDHARHINDIGVLLLMKDVSFTSLIRPICLPESSELRAMTFEKYNPMVAGWGSTSYRGSSAEKLQVVQLPVVSNSQCTNAYREYTSLAIDQSILCAGYVQGGQDACQGDSGGPLMQPYYNQTIKNALFYQIGVVSFGKKCAEPGFPGVYARVTYYIPWLREKILGVAAQ